METKNESETIKLKKAKKSAFEKFGLFYLEVFEKKNKKKYSEHHFKTDEQIKKKTNKILTKSILLTLIVSILTVTPLVYFDLALRDKPALVYWSWLVLLYVLFVAFEFYCLFLIALKLVHDLQNILKLNAYSTDLLSIPTFKIENILARTALELPDPELEVLGIDSFKNISKKNLFVITLLYKGKIVLTNFILKYLLLIFIGEKIFGVSILYSAVLVECFWNVLVIRKVLIDARLRLFGFKLSHEIMSQFKNANLKQQLSITAQKGCLRAIGNSIVMTKNYHPNMIFLLVHFQKELEVNEPDRFDDWALFIETLSQVTPEERFLLLDLFSVATAFDGSISSLENNQIKEVFGESFPEYIDRIKRLIDLLQTGHFYKALNECRLDFTEG